MRILVCTILAWLGASSFGLAKDPLEIRAYRADPTSFKVFEMETGFGVFDEEMPVFEARKIAKPPFQSRFFSPDGPFLNYTEWARSVELFNQNEGEAIYDVKSKRLVVRTDRVRHCFLQDCLRSFLKTQLKVTFELREIPEVSPGKRVFQKARWAIEGEEVASLTRLTQSGQNFVVGTPDGKFTIEAKCVTGFRGADWECRFSLDSKLAGAEINLRTGLVGVLGLPTFFELGSLDGKSTLATAVTVREVLPDGSSIDEWVLAEGGRNVVRERRLKKALEYGDDKVELGNGRRYQLFLVPPNFWTFLGGDVEGKKSPREIFRENGVPLKDSDRVLRLPGGIFFAVEADIKNLKIVDDLTMAAGMIGTPTVLAGHFTLVESEKRLTPDDLKQGNYEVIRKISAPTWSGSPVSLGLGQGELALDFEMQSADWEGQSISARFEVKADQKLAFTGERETKVNAPFIEPVGKVDGRSRAWVLVFSSQPVAETIKAGK